MQKGRRFMAQAVGFALALSSLCPASALADEARIMPLAAQSLLLDVAVAGESLVTVGERGHALLVHPQDGRWQQAVVPSRQMLTSVHFVDARRGWAAGHDGLILVTSDGGESWAVQYDGLSRQQGINRRRLESLRREREVLEAQIAVTAQSSERRLLVEQLGELGLDLEDAELDLDSPLQTPPLLDIWFDSPLRGFAVGAFGTLLVTQDGGLNWQSMGDRLENPEQLHLNAITGDRSGSIWIAGEGGQLFRTTDGGSSWTALESPYFGTFFGISRAPRSGRLLVFGLRGNAFYSDDNGASWSASNTGSKRTLFGGVWLDESQVLLVGGVGSVLVSDDGGSTFDDRSLPLRYDLSAIAASQGRLLAVGRGGLHRVEVTGDY